MFCQNFRRELQEEDLCQKVFEKMNKTERYHCVQKKGQEMLSRKISDHFICLFLLTDFFVEIWYETSSNKIDRIDITTPDEITANYEDEIDLTGLF